MLGTTKIIKVELKTINYRLPGSFNDVFRNTDGIPTATLMVCARYKDSYTGCCSSLRIEHPYAIICKTDVR